MSSTVAYRRGFFIAFLFGCAALLAPVARAQECETKAECPDGFLCEAQDVGTCPVVDCIPGESCKDPVCEPTKISVCVVPPCTKDEDCPTGMVCNEETRMECSGGGSEPTCEPGAVCPKGDAGAPDCTTVTERACTARYELPCEQDNDCGPGFLCVEQKNCMCSGGGSAGSSGSGTAGGGAMGVPEPAPDAPEDQCSCEPTGEFACDLQETECAKDSDCPMGMSCEDDPNGAVCSGTGVGGGSAAADAGVRRPPQDGGAAPNGAAEPDACEMDPAPRQICLPPYYAYGRGGVAGSDSGAVPGTQTGGKDGSGEGATPAKPHSSSDDDCTVSAPGGSHATEGLSVFGLLGAVALLWQRRARRRAVA